MSIMKQPTFQNYKILEMDLKNKNRYQAIPYPNAMSRVNMSSS